jgi:hypothetical protein
MTYRSVALAIALSLLACSKTDTGVGVTTGRDFTLTVSVRDRFIRIGDALPVRVQLRRTDSSNLPLGLKGSIVLTATANGALERDNIPVNVTNASTVDVSENVVFTGRSAGAAVVRASYGDASASVEIVVSGVTP